MNTYKRHRFSPDFISYAIWLYFRFNLSHRDIEHLLAERGINVTRELKRKHRGYGATFYIDEVFVKINGKQHYLWRTVDQDGEAVDVCLQAKRDGASTKSFFKRLLRSYGVAHRELIPETIHSTEQYENNWAEQSHEATRVRERGMRKLKSVGQAQRFPGAHAAVGNVFNLGRHLVSAQHYRHLSISACSEWSRAVA
jgi:putative transposase